MNSRYIDCDNEAGDAFFMDLFARGLFRFEHLEGWLENQAKPLPSSLDHEAVESLRFHGQALDSLGVWIAHN